MAEYELMFEKSGGTPMAHAWIGMARAVIESRDDGLASVERAIEDSPEDPSMSAFLGLKAMVHFESGDYAEARDAARLSTRLPQVYTVGPHAGLYLMLAVSLAHLGELDEARAALAEARELRPALRTEVARVGFAGANSDFLERYLDGLRMAGLEE